MWKKLLAALAMFYAAMSFAAVDANTATAAELDSVKGIGPGMSTRIIDERKKSPFKDWSDLISRVKGVGNKNAVKFSTGGLTVNGVAYSGAPAAAPAAKPAAQTAPAAAKPAVPATPAAPTMGAKPAAAAAAKP